LSSDILKRSKKETLYTIAHELASVYLELPKTVSSIKEFSEIEREIDKQLIKWNFESKLWKKHFNHIYGDGRIQNESYHDAR
jgi:hypothetical protein